MKSLTVVVPVFNEIECLPLFHERITDVIEKLRDEIRVELLFVDDGSTDGSFLWLSGLVKRDRTVRVLKFSRNLGSYVALTAGLAHASGDAAVLISADLQEPPELIPEMVEKWRSGYDVVWAERRSRSQDPLWKRLTSTVFYMLFRRIAFADYPPKGYDFCLIDRAVIDVVVKSQERNTSIFALIVWANFENTAIPYDRLARAKGASHWTPRQLVRLAVDSIMSFSVLPVRLGLWCAVLVGLGLLGYMSFIVYGKVTNRFVFPAGWPSIMTVILLTSGLQLLVLAILGEYLWRSLDRARGRPLYVVTRKLGYEAGAGDSAARSDPPGEVMTMPRRA